MPGGLALWYAEIGAAVLPRLPLSATDQEAFVTLDSTVRARAYAGDADLPAIAALLNLCAAHDGLHDRTAVADLRVVLTHPDIDPARDLRLWEDANGRLVAFAQLWVTPREDATEGGLNVRVDPDARETGLGDAVFTWGTGRLAAVARERGMPALLRLRVPEKAPDLRALAERHGMTVVRYFFRMACPLDQSFPAPALPPGFTLIDGAGPRDVAAWVAAFNQSFVDHWNHHPETVEAQQHWLDDPAYRPEHDLAALAPDGTLAAFCVAGVDADANALAGRREGWIHLLGTRRGYRERGLGRALLLAGLRVLQAEGLDSALLGVDAENPTGALGLYERVGFRRIETTTVYSRDLPEDAP